MGPEDELIRKEASLAVSGADSFTRRSALQLFAAQMALTVAGCSKPQEEIVPYVRIPERVVPGEILRFATTLPLGGYGRGVLGISTDGRPIKIEGNTHHPASLGATDVFAEAAVLSLYDPDRSRTTVNDGGISSWDMFLAMLLPEMERFSATNGEGLRLLTGRVTSPTLLRQIGSFLSSYPNAGWHAYEPIGNENESEGAQIAFGKPLRPRPRLDDADVILALDADPLGPGPDQIRNAHDWAKARNPTNTQAFSRVYVAESALTLTGAKADHRLALHPHTIANVAIAVANALGARLPDPKLPKNALLFAQAAAKKLSASRQRALVLVGSTQSPAVHALAHWINHQLNAPVDFIEPIDRPPGRASTTLRELAHDLDAGKVNTVVIINANPLYDAPADLRFAERLIKSRLRIHLGSHLDETARQCQWHIPLSHPLESWSDLRAPDGTASIVQPLLQPLYASRTAHELIAAMTGRPDASPYDLVRETWRPMGDTDFDTWWRKSLHDGVIAQSNADPVAAGTPQLPSFEPGAEPKGMSLVLRPDPCVWDGSWANNPWLQECPKPLSKEVWSHSLSISPVDASKLRVQTGDLVRITVKDRSIEVPARIEPGAASGVASLALGYGRRNAGAIGNDIGANAYVLRTTEAPWRLDDVTLSAMGQRRDILTTQNNVRLDGDPERLYQRLFLNALANGGAIIPSKEPLPTHLPPHTNDTYAWGMVIDTSACIGCNACVVACQAENNVPVVGPEEVARGRDMHWLRVDIYDHGTPVEPKPGFQPVPCMHCEHAPCEPVCPVAASVHDGEGLNLQVYNRCVGTRFCEANCPYKVRRFNFFGYADGQEYANLGAETIRAQHNPEVSTRQRGVMEKCTYCIQRISRARRGAEKEDRRIADGEVVTACQSACPTRAISFGDIGNDSAVARLKTDARNYELLGHLGTRPRTTYLADVRNFDPALKDDA
jgi:molybdopterin-containing oxidoreductase family iron-sulfur binding subunit